MIAALLSLALGAAVPAPGLCDAVESESPGKPALSATYLTIGDEEAAADRPESATAAYREAVRLDAANTQARAKWLASCRGGDSEFEAAVALMDAGDCRAAADRLKALRAASPDPGAALMEGICRYELGEDAAAAVALKEAESEPSLLDSVRFFRGLLALRAGRTDEAERLFRQVTTSTDPRLQGGAQELIRVTKQQSRLVLSAQAEAGYDSNVSLAPDGDPSLGRAGDGYVAHAAAALWRPFAGKGGFLSAGGQYRKQFSTGLFDVGAVSGAAGWFFSGETASLGLDYTFDYLAIAHESYLQGHRLQARGRKSFRRLGLNGVYSLRRENFVRSNERDFSGFRHFGQADVDWAFAAGSSVMAGYRAGMDAAQLAVLSYVEHGPVVGAMWRVARPVRIGAEATAWWRDYNDVWTEDGQFRSDRVVDLWLVADWFATESWTVRAQVGSRRVVSNVPSFSFTKVTASLGLSYATGLF